MAETDVIGQVIGNWGRWQLRAVLLIYLCKIPSAWFMACIIFTAPTPRNGEFFCRAPTDIAVDPLTANGTLPWDTESTTSVYADNNGQSLIVDFCSQHNDTATPCPDFEHSSAFNSLVTQFDLVCSKTILIAVTQFFHLFGVLTGGLLANKFLEVQSPRMVMLVGMITQIICGCVTGLAIQFEVHVFFRYLSAVSCAQMYTAGQMILQRLLLSVSDITGGKYKTGTICMFENFWSIGVIILPLLAFLLPDWSNLYLAISLPTIGYMLLWFMIPDSPRWLLRHGRIAETKMYLQHADAMNQTSNITDDLDQRLADQVNVSLKAPTPAGWWSLWKGPRAASTMVAVHCAWASYVTNYNGMLLNVKAFGRDLLSVNTILLGVAEILGVSIGLLLILRVERKWQWTGAFNVIAGLLCSTGYLLPATFSERDTSVYVMFTAFIAKVAVSTSQSMLFSSTVELVPPEKRMICMFSCVLWARLWLLSAPFIGALVGFHQILPLSAFGIISIIGGIATISIRSKELT